MPKKNLQFLIRLHRGEVFVPSHDVPREFLLMMRLTLLRVFHSDLKYPHLLNSHSIYNKKFLTLHEPVNVAAILLAESPPRRKMTARNHSAPSVTTNNSTAPTPQKGLIVLRIAPSNATGNVVEPASLSNVEITALSRQSANDSNPPATIAEAISGKVICRNARAGGAPRSPAASSSD